MPQHEELGQWVLSRVSNDLRKLSICFAAKNIDGVELSDDLVASCQRPPENWNNLLFAGSFLSQVGTIDASKAALLIALSAIQLSDNESVKSAAATILTQLSNHFSINLACRKAGLSEEWFDECGPFQKMLLKRRHLNQTVQFLNHEINDVQLNFHQALQKKQSVAVSAQTAAGKTFFARQWLLNEFANGNVRMAAVIAPSRALVSEIERSLIREKRDYRINAIRISSMPISGLADGTNPSILVFTPERMNVFLKYVSNENPFEICLIDEAHQIADGQRGMVLESALERIQSINQLCRFIFLSPLVENPDIFLSSYNLSGQGEHIKNGIPLVLQNLYAVRKPYRQPRVRELQLVEHSNEIVGKVEFNDEPRPADLAFKIGETNGKTILYANGPAEAAKFAGKIKRHFPDKVENIEAKEQLDNLVSLSRGIVHEDYQLNDLLPYGVAYHDGPMPDLLRREIERLFKEGVIKYICCTSTLLAGVNVDAKNIILSKPRTGRGNPISPQDFWNLVGRSGRWGKDFCGNILCFDDGNWEQPIPERQNYSVKRSSRHLMESHHGLIDFAERRFNFDYLLDLGEDVWNRYESLLAYFCTQGNLNAILAEIDGLEDKEKLAELISSFMADFTINESIVTDNIGVSAFALGGLHQFFQSQQFNIHQYIPLAPQATGSRQRLQSIFTVIDEHMFPVFVTNKNGSSTWRYRCASITQSWMLGKTIREIVDDIFSATDTDREKVIIGVLRDVRDIARYKAPKYLSAYMSVLKEYLSSINRMELYPEDDDFIRYLEYGVGTKTLLSLTEIGLDRDRALIVNKLLQENSLGDELSVERVMQFLSEFDIDGWDTFEIVKDDIRFVLNFDNGEAV